MVSIFKGASKFFLKNWATLLLAAMFTVGITEALFGIRGNLILIPTDKGAYPLMLLQLAIPLIGFIALQGITVQFVVRDAQMDGIRSLDATKSLLRRLPLLITVGLLNLSLTIAGFILLIVPGIIVMVWFFLVIQVTAIEENHGIIASFRRSKDLVSGNFWLVLGVIIIIVLPFSVVNYLTSIMSMNPSYLYSWIDYVIDILMRLFVSVIGAQTYLKLALIRAVD